MRGLGKALVAAGVVLLVISAIGGTMQWMGGDWWFDEFWPERVEKTTCYEGIAQSPNVTLKIPVGSVQIRGCPGDQYNLTITTIGMGMTQEEARAREEGIHITTRTEPDDIKVVAHAGEGEWRNWRGRKVDVLLSIPNATRIKIEGDTASVRIDELDFQQITCNLDTAEVRLTSTSFEKGTIETDTGSIHIDGAYRVLRCESDTGGIHVGPSPNAQEVDLRADTGGIWLDVGNSSASYRCEIDTGSIWVSAPETDGIGYRIDARTDIGSVWMWGSRTKRSLSTETPNYAEAPIKIIMELETDTGSIHVS